MTTRNQMKHRKKNNAIVRLGCAALALPGLMQTATAGRVEETYNADFQYGHYSEGKARMQVDIFDAALSAPIGKDYTVNVGILRDIVSGASPVYNYRENGQIKQYLSRASAINPCGGTTPICEQRDQLTAGITKFFDTSALSVGGGLSREHDYTSKFFNTNYSIDLNKKLTTLNFGASVAFDDVEPTPSQWSNPNWYPAQVPADQRNQSGPYAFHAHKTSQNYLIGMSQVVDKDTLFQSNMTFGYSDGYLTDPYKLVGSEGGVYYNPFFSMPAGTFATVSEVRPGSKFQWAWLNQYVHHFGQLNDAALHVDYRYSLDTWGSHSHTVEASWHQPIVDDWQIIPKFRYYSQDKADFYQPIFNDIVDANTKRLVNHAYYSSDYRLAGFGALSGGIKLSKEFTKLKGIHSAKFQTGFEYYTHESSLQLGGNNQNSFADFNYYLVTASFNLKF